MPRLRTGVAVTERTLIMKELPSIRFGHVLQSGRRIEVIFRRQEDRRPSCDSSFDCSQLTTAELEEYIQWRDAAIAPIVMSTLTPGEVFATAAYELSHGQKGEG